MEEIFNLNQDKDGMEDSIFLSQVEEGEALNPQNFIVQMLPSCNWRAKFSQPVVTRKKYAAFAHLSSLISHGLFYRPIILFTK